LKKYILTLLILILTVFSLGCINNNNNNQTSGNLTYHITDKDPNKKNYEDNEISFDYPSFWNLSGGKHSVSLFNGKKQVTIEKSVLNAVFKSGNVFSTVPPPQEVVSNEIIKVDGLNSQKIVHKSKVDSEPSRIEINVNKSGRLFKIYCYAPPAEFNNAQTEFNLIINSLKLK